MINRIMKEQRGTEIIKTEVRNSGKIRCTGPEKYSKTLRVSPLIS